MLKRLLLTIGFCLLSSGAWAACAGSLTFPLNSGTATWTGISDSGGTNCVLGSAPMPSASSSVGLTPATTTAVASNLVVKSSAGNLYSFLGTTGSTAGCFMIFNATSLPANGTVTPIYIIQAAANQTVGMTLMYPAVFSTGITIGFSSTCGYSLTASSTAAIAAQYQ